LIGTRNPNDPGRYFQFSLSKRPVVSLPDHYLVQKDNIPIYLHKRCTEIASEASDNSFF